MVIETGYENGAKLRANMTFAVMTTSTNPNTWVYVSHADSSSHSLTLYDPQKEEFTENWDDVWEDIAFIHHLYDFASLT
jgi:hypothetical protein